MTQTLVKLVADFSTTLVSKVAVGDTTATLTSGLDEDGVQLPTGTYGFTIDRNNSQKEHFTATLTGSTLTNIKHVTRGTGTGTSGFNNTHRKGAEVVITDHVALKRISDILDGTTKLDSGTVLEYDSTVTPTLPNQLVTKSLLDSTALGTVTVSRVVLPGNAGETVTAGMLLYLDVSDGEWKKCDADTAATVDNIVMGIAQGAGTDGNPITGGLLLQGLDQNQTGLTNNTAYYASNTAGEITATPGTTEVSIGVSRSTTSVLFFPRYNQQLTENQQDALDGTSGTPSSTNKFVTNDDTASASTADKVARRNSTGDLTVPTTPTASTDATSKSYVQASTGFIDTTSYKLGESFTGATAPEAAVVIDDLHQFMISSTSLAQGVGYATTNPSERATKIIPRTTTTAYSIRTYLGKTGAPTDNFYFEIQSDSAGVPSNTPISNGTSGVYAGGSLSTTAMTEVELTFATPPTLTAGTTYWVVTKRSSSLSDTNYFNIPTLVYTDAYASFVGAEKIAAGAWSSSNKNMPYFQIKPGSAMSKSLWKSDANHASKVLHLFYGFCTTTGSAGDSATLVKGGDLSGFTGLLPGVQYYTSVTAGSYQHATAYAMVGTATSSTTMRIPQRKYGAIETGWITPGVSGEAFVGSGSRSKFPFGGIINITSSGNARGVYMYGKTFSENLISLDVSPTTAIPMNHTVDYSPGAYFYMYQVTSSVTNVFTPIIDIE